MQSVLGGSLHKNNTSYLLLRMYHASVNRISIVLMQITPQDERYYGICAISEWCVKSYSSYTRQRHFKTSSTGDENRDFIKQP